MRTYLRANKAAKSFFVKGAFDEVVKYFQNRKDAKVTECRVTDKNKTLWINGINMSTIIHPDNKKI